MAFRQFIDEAADGEILDKGAVAVDEDHRVALPLFDVVEAHGIHVEEASDGRGLALRGTRLDDRVDGGCARGDHHVEQGHKQPLVHEFLHYA